MNRIEMEEERVVILSKNGEEVTLGEIEGDATDEDVSGILVLGVPGGLLADAECSFSGIDVLSALH